MISITLNGLPCIPLTDELTATLAVMGEDITALNCLTWPTGASKSAKAIFLVHSEVAKSLAQGDRSQAISVVMKDDSLSATDGTIYASMFQTEHRPIHFSKASEPSEGLYAITLVDDRYFWTGINTDSSFNVTTSADRSSYYDETKNGASAWTWGQVIDHLAGLLGVYIDSSAASASGDPTDYLLTSEPVTVALDRVCSSLGLIFVAELAGGFSVKSPASLNSNAAHHNIKFLRERMAGGSFRDSSTTDGKAWLDAIMPSEVVVRFPRQVPPSVDAYNASNPPPLRQFCVLTSSSGKPTGAVGRSAYKITLDDAMWAIGPVGAETNLSALQLRADAVSAAYYTRWQTTLNDCRLMGFVNLGPVSGTVIWRLSASGAFTDIHVLDGLTDADKTGDGVVIGLGNVQAHRTRDGALVISGNAGNGGNGGIGTMIPLKLSSTVTMGGVYTVGPLTAPTSNMNHTGSTFTDTTLGSSGATTGYFYNLPEMGQTTHDLASTMNEATVVLGLEWSVNSDGTINYLGTGIFPGCS